LPAEPILGWTRESLRLDRGAEAVLMKSPAEIGTENRRENLKSFFYSVITNSPSVYEGYILGDTSYYTPNPP